MDIIYSNVHDTFRHDIPLLHYMLPLIHIQDIKIHCSKFRLSPQNLIRSFSPVFYWVIIWALGNCANSRFFIFVHTIIIGVEINEIILVINHNELSYFPCSTELFPQKIRIMSKILRIRIIHYRCIGIGGI